MTVLNTQVLVLNQNFEAVKVTDARTAFILLFRGVAEAVDYECESRSSFSVYDFDSWYALSEYKSEFEEDSYRWIKCIGDNLAIPRIVRLTTSRHRARKMKLTRRNIFSRDKNTCQYCGSKFSTSDLSLDHIIPRSRGGRNTWDNLVCACLKCNTKKADSTPEEAKMKLINKAGAPDNSFNLPRLDLRHWSWKHFVDAAYWDVELKD